MYIKFILYLVVVTFTVQCSCDRKKHEPTIQEIRDTEEAMVNVNRMLVQKDRIKILEYIKQNELNMKELESGLWYQIVQEGKGRKVDDQTVVTLTYHLSLLNGTLLYSSDSLGPKQFRVGKGGVESGLEEGILLLNEGSSAIFILPPHLAHGLTGDGNKIPARSVVVYKVELNKVEPV